MPRRGALLVLALLGTACPDDGGGEGADEGGTDAATSGGSEGDGSGGSAGSAADGTSGLDTSGGADADETGSDETGGGPGPEVLCDADGFEADGRAWSLPEMRFPLEDYADAPNEQLAGSWQCTNGQQYQHNLLDLTGDGVTDFLVRDACDEGGVGEENWLVFPGGTDGFGEATAWSLPALEFPLEAYPDTPLEQLVGSWQCTNGQQYQHTVMDMTADGRPDLLVRDACDEGGVGEETWLLYPGEDGGFGGPQPWTLPALEFPLEAYPDTPLEQLAGSWQCTNGQQYQHTVMDMTADGRPDLLVRDACDEGGVGEENWLLYPGEDGGFGDPQPWSLPALTFPLEAYPDTPLEQSAGTWQCTNGQQYQHTMLDVNGDRWPDLLVTDACDEGGVGEENWLLYPGGEGGFGAPGPWSLPALEFPLEAYADAPLEQLSGNWQCTNGQQYQHSVMDVTGDRILDLLVRDACDEGGVGEGQWLVYAGGEDGFAADPFAWALPELSLPLEDYADTTLEQLAGTWQCTNGQQYSHTVLDLSADGAIDLVVHDACDEDGVGATQWLLFDGLCG
ncbi:MAG: hypothetical protein AAGA54_36215 [Myxococcota bacterium]